MKSLKHYNYEHLLNRAREKERETEDRREEEMNSYVIKQAILPALEDDIVSDVSVDEGGETIFVG